MIEYKEFRTEYMEQAYQIYAENKWESYLGDVEKLTEAFNQSLYILGAFEDGVLAGFVRCVGDGQYILYIQDLIIRPSHFRKGIARELMHRVSEKYPGIRQFVLITDEDDEVSNAFYQAIGMERECNGYPVSHYFRGMNKL